MKKKSLVGFFLHFYVTGAADSNTLGSPSTFRSLSQRSGERIPPFRKQMQRVEYQLVAFDFHTSRDAIGTKKTQKHKSAVDSPQR
ncbi:MAG: hypothetical protein IKZ92_04980 [Muribaculaceae bacterium]|nr:hypothetical protein [Muribaculaceae bacterium]